MDVNDIICTQCQKKIINHDDVCFGDDGTLHWEHITQEVQENGI